MQFRTLYPDQVDFISPYDRISYYLPPPLLPTPLQELVIAHSHSKRKRKKKEKIAIGNSAQFSCPDTPATRIYTPLTSYRTMRLSAGILLYGDLADIMRRATNQLGRAFVHLPPVKRSRYSRIAAVSPPATFGHKVGQSLAAMLVPHPAVPNLGNPDTSLSRMNLRGLLKFSMLSQNLSYCPRSPAVRERFFGFGHAGWRGAAVSTERTGGETVCVCCWFTVDSFAWPLTFYPVDAQSADRAF